MTDVAPGATGQAAPGAVQSAVGGAFGTGGTGSAQGGGQQAQAPGVAVSPYEYSLLEGDQVIIGATMANLLHIPSMANTVVQASKVLQAFFELPLQQQGIVGTYLYNAGFWVNASGEKPTTQPVFTSSDADMQNALSLALLTTSNKNLGASPKGSTLSSVVESQIASGAGQAENAPTPSPVLGGENTYQVTLTSPADLYNTLYTTWEQNLGYAPDQKTLNNFVNVFQKEQGTYQQALNAQQENASYAKWEQQRGARNIQQSYLTTPNVPGGRVPTGPYATPAAWASAFVTYLGAEGIPYTSSNVAYILGIVNQLGNWSQASKSFNPLGSQAPLPGAETPVTSGTPNPNAPYNYPSWSEGMKGALENLAKYPGIWALLMSGNASDPKVQAQYSANTQGVNPESELSTMTNGKITGPIVVKPGERAAADHVAAVATRLAHKAGTPAPSKSMPSGGAASPGVAGGIPPQQPESANAAQAPGAPPVIPNPDNSIQYRATHVPTGPGFSTAAINPVQAAQPPGPTDYTGKSFNVPAPGTPGAANPAAGKAGAPEEPSIKQALAKAMQIRQQAKGGTLPSPNISNIPSTLPSDLTTQANQYSTGDTYLGSSTLVGTTPPSSQALAFQEATTGANAVPFQGNEYLNAFNTIADMIASGRVNG